MNIDKICKEVAQESGEDVKLVHSIVMHQFQFIRDVMNDPMDTHDVLINKLFRFKLKTRFKQDKTQKYSSK
jgi:hypothetical protein